jgi:hypothetical protein
VIYSGQETNFDLTKMKKAAWGFTFSVEESSEKIQSSAHIGISLANDLLNVQWNGLKLSLPVKPLQQPQNL